MEQQKGRVLWNQHISGIGGHSCQNLSNSFPHWKRHHVIIKEHMKLVLSYYQRPYKTDFFLDLILILHRSPPFINISEKPPLYKTNLQTSILLHESTHF